jgi:hypothetical protein
MLDSLKPQNDLIQKVKRMEKSTALPRTWALVDSDLLEW